MSYETPEQRQKRYFRDKSRQYRKEIKDNLIADETIWYFNSITNMYVVMEFLKKKLLRSYTQVEKPKTAPYLDQV